VGVRHRWGEMVLRGAPPAGERLSIPDLATAFGVSTMPVREAIRHLQAEGLVDVAPRRWTRVAMPDPALADEIYPVLAELERIAISSAPGAPVSAIATARAANRALAEAAERHDVLGCAEADHLFHATLIGLNPNRTLRRIIEELKGRLQLLESVYYRHEDVKDSLAHHEQILDALVRQDFATAGERAAANWIMGLEKVREQILDGDHAPSHGS
jgi:DNA-binding GntR family transcriptional regulator